MLNLKKLTAAGFPDVLERQYAIVCNLNLRLKHLQSSLSGIHFHPTKDFTDLFASYLLDYDWRIKLIVSYMRTVESKSHFRSLAPAEVVHLQRIDSNLIIRLEEKINLVEGALNKLEVKFESAFEPFEEEALLEFAFRTENLFDFIAFAPILKNDKTPKVQKKSDSGFLSIFKESEKTIERPVYYPLPFLNEQGILVNPKIKEIEASKLNRTETIDKSRRELDGLLNQKREQLRTEFLDTVQNFFSGKKRTKEEVESEAKMLEQFKTNAKATNERITNIWDLWSYAAKPHEESQKSLINRMKLLKEKVDRELGEGGTRSDPFEVLREEGLEIEWISIEESCFIQSDPSQSDRREIFGEILGLLAVSEFGFKQLGKASKEKDGQKQTSVSRTVSESQLIPSPKYLIGLEGLALKSSVQEEIAQKPEKTPVATSYDKLGFWDLGNDLFMKVFQKNNKAHVVFKRKLRREKESKIEFINILTLPLEVHEQADKSNERTVVVSQTDSKGIRPQFMIFSTDDKDFLYRIDLSKLVGGKQLPKDPNEYIWYSLVNLLPLRARTSRWEPKLLKFLSLSKTGTLNLSFGKSETNTLEPLGSVELNSEGHWLKLVSNRYGWIQQCEDLISVSIVTSTDKGMQVAVVNRKDSASFELKLLDSMGICRSVSLPVLNPGESSSLSVETLRVFPGDNKSSARLTVLALLKSADQKRALLRILFLEGDQVRHCDFDISEQASELKGVESDQLDLTTFVELNQNETQRLILRVDISDLSMMITL